MQPEHLIPTPRLMQVSDQRISLDPGNLRIWLAGEGAHLEELTTAGNLLVRLFPCASEDNVDWRLDTSRPAKFDYPPKDWMTLQITDVDARFGDEGYLLKIGDGVLIQGRTGKALMLGIQTLCQLASQDEVDSVISLPAVTIMDWPHYQWRGIMLDQGRNFQSIAFLKEQLDVAARYKLNIFHMHLTDYPGWRFQVKGIPGLASGKSYSQEELRMLVKYGEEQGVQIIPEIEMPGHCTEFIDKLPHLKCTNETMCMGKEATYETLRQVLTEVAEVFPAPYIHIGTDECAGGEDCADCKARWEQIQGEPGHPPTLMSYFMHRVNAIVNGLGKTAICWNDQTDNGIPSNMIIQAWTPGCSAPAIAHEGFTVINSRCPVVYFDHGNLQEYLSQIYKWDPCEGADPCPSTIIGGQGEAWHDPPVEHEDQILEDLAYFPKEITIAERLWQGPTGRELDFEAFCESIEEHKERYFKSRPFPFPEQSSYWQRRYEGWTVPRGIWHPPG